MDNRSLVKLAAAVLGLVAIGLLVTWIVIAQHGALSCGSESSPCLGGDATDAAASTYFAIKALTFGTGASLGLASMVLLGYLSQTPAEPAADR